MSQRSLFKAKRIGFYGDRRHDDRLYFFEDKETGVKRNTGVVASSEEEARKRLKRPSPKNAKLTGQRALTEQEQDQVAKGKWVRNRLNGQPPSSDNNRGYGPPRRLKKG